MRLIDADATLNLLKSLGSRDYRRSKGTIAEAEKMLMHEEYTPTIDVEPVVRCKECKCWDSEHISSEGYARCLTGESGVRYRKENDFCSRGERKSNNK